MRPSIFESITIKGRVVEGLKESSSFTHITWVRGQFITKLGIDPYPGTLNLDIADEDKQIFREIKTRKGIEIVPGEPGFCSAKCFHVLVCDRVRGAVVIPLVPDYPESKLEIISSVKIRDALSLEIGDPVSVEMFLNAR